MPGQHGMKSLSSKHLALLKQSSRPLQKHTTIDVWQPGSNPDDLVGCICILFQIYQDLGAVKDASNSKKGLAKRMDI